MSTLNVEGSTLLLSPLGGDDEVESVAAFWAMDVAEGWRYSYVCWRTMLLSCGGRRGIS